MPDTTTMIADAPLPRIHLGGTHPSTLQEEAEVALLRLRQLRKALLEVTVHPRDFDGVMPDGIVQYNRAVQGVICQTHALDAIEQHLTKRLELALENAR